MDTGSDDHLFYDRAVNPLVRVDAAVCGSLHDSRAGGRHLAFSVVIGGDAAMVTACRCSNPDFTDGSGAARVLYGDG